MHIGCVIDKLSTYAVQAFEQLSSLYNILDVEHCSKQDFDVILTLGGDGAMLKALHSFMHNNIPIFGMNRGSIGFLLNSYSTDDLISRIQKASTAILSPLEMKVIDKDGKTHSHLAINEVSLIRETHQAAKIKINVNGELRLNHLVSDGVLVATPAGSTAYNYAVGGPIIPINANVMALSPISPFRPRQWHGALILRSDTVQLEVLETYKRPVSASADSAEVRDAKFVEIKERSDIKLSVLFDSDDKLETRAIKEQFI
ncbi:MAG: NAD kinase [Candidatus Midichloria sp.]|nr:NAD kinase [Candidatus Midichloria sp.]